MRLYRYKAVDAQGRTRVGKARAANEADLELRVQRMGLELIRFRTAAPRARFTWGQGLRRRELILFCFHLEQTIRAGVPAPAALQDLHDSADHPRLRAAIAAMLESIEGGKTLAEALSDFPGMFSEVFTSLIRVGEQTGELRMVLERLGENLKWQDEQAAMAGKLFIYPSFIFVVVMAVVFFLMIYLVPELLAFVMTTGQTLPAHTLLLISLSDLVSRYWHIILLAPVLAVGVCAGLVRVNPWFGLTLARLQLKLPWFGPALKKLILARCFGCFAMMYSSGITVVECLGAAQRVAGNPAIAQAMRDVGRAMTDGSSLADSCARSGLFPPLALRIIRVGEANGALQASLENVAYFYTRDVRESVGRLQAIVEPTMTLILGALIGWVMLSVLGPIYDLITRVRT